MALPKNYGSLKKLIIDDQLHIAAIDFVFLELVPKEMVDIKGVTKKNNRWTLINGTHQINYGHDAGKPCYIHATRDKDTYTIEINGDEPTKSIYKILNAKRVKIINESFIREIDMFIMKEKNLQVNGGFTADVIPFPMDDIYTISTSGQSGYIILKKESSDDKSSYTIDIVGDYYKNIIDGILSGNANRVRIVNCSIVNKKILVRTMDNNPMQDIYPSQKVIVDYVIDTYTTSQKKNIIILVSGDSGLGKSTIAFWITQMMKTRLSVDPYLIKGFNINCEEIQYHPIINHYSPKSNSPIILLLDEFDIAMKKADMPDSPDKSAHTISANKTNMNNFLDSINEEQFLIVVATTNTTIDEINNKFKIYCRKGRFHKHFEMKSKTVVNSFDPV